MEEILWGSQQRLYRRMKDELDKQMASPDNGKHRELYVRVAKMVRGTNEA